MTIPPTAAFADVQGAGSAVSSPSASARGSSVARLAQAQQAPPTPNSRDRNTSLKATASYNSSQNTGQAAQEHIQGQSGQQAQKKEAVSEPAAAMHWAEIRPKGSGKPPPLRAHTTTVVGSKLYVFGGCDADTCYADLHILDTETLWWTKMRTQGSIPAPCRAHSASLVQNRFLVVFAGGDGPNYFNTLHYLDTVTLVWYAPQTTGPVPSPRRAHSAFVYGSDVYIYAGGDGIRALADLYKLNTSILTVGPAPVLTWTQLTTSGTQPESRGYHTTNLIRNTPHLVLYGGSDGHECFSSIHMLNLQTLTWSTPTLAASPPRLSHTATQIGSYLFVLGGHDGSHYNNTILLLNLVTMSWETRSVCGKDRPAGRGYHTAVLCDSRLWVIGGYDGGNVFGDCWVLELGASAYLPQITTFQVAGDAAPATNADG